MSKKNIRLEAIDPIEIYGAANKNLEALCSYFPELKVVARGNEIILEGKDTDVEEFEEKLKKLVNHGKKKKNIRFWMQKKSGKTTLSILAICRFFWNLCPMIISNLLEKKHQLFLMY